MTACNLQYLHDVRIGYGRYGTDLHHALEAAGVKVYDEMPGIDAKNVPGFDREPLGVPRNRGLTNAAMWVTAPPHVPGRWSDQRLVLATMWEAVELPEGMRANLHNFDTLIVPSIQNQELFGEFHNDVRVGWIGTDIERWKYQPRQAPNREFRFLVAGKNQRKGVDLAVKAFRKCFPEGSWGDGPVPKLWIKGGHRSDVHGPRVEVMPAVMTPEEEVDLYAQAHVYVQPSRGEGFGLQPLQAICQGLPTILTDAHGHKAFSDLGMGLSTTLAPAPFFMFGDAGTWWEPSLDDLCEWMLYAYEHYDDCLKTSRLNSEKARARFNWPAVIAPYVASLEGSVEVSDGGTWVPLEHRQYLAVTNRNQVSEIAGVRYRFDKGERYFVPADVKRVLFEAGCLDDVCLPPLMGDDLHGLTLEQVQRIGEHLASVATCPTCGQPEREVA